MTTAAFHPPVQARRANGGAPARSAVVRWAWRLFKREWRQQLLILALIVLAVGATIIGAAVATNTPQPTTFGFGTAQDLASFPTLNHHVAGEIAALQHRFGRTEVIESETFTIPGSINTYQLRAENPRGPFVQPMLALLSGHFPTGPAQVAVTPGVASDFNLSVGDHWQAGGTTRLVVGTVDNPQSLLDEFGLVVPGQVRAPSQVSVLFDAGGVRAASIGPNVETPALVAQSNPLNPQTISLAVLTIGMLLIAIMAVGGFTVLAQRRLRSLGMLASLGATDKLVSLVVRANGVAVGVVGAIIGTAVGLAGWLAYRPSLEASSHHVIAIFALPWLVVALAIVLAVLATYFAASRPARAMTRLPIVSALSGRPPLPRQVHRSALPGIAFLVVSFLLLGYAGAGSGQGGGSKPELVFGLVALIPGVILLAPFFLSLLARLGKAAPLSVRLPLRDLARYRARSGSALSAIAIGVLVAVIIVIVAGARYGNVLDYAGPNLASNQLILYTPNSDNGGAGRGLPSTATQMRTMQKSADAIAASLGSHDVITLEQTSASLNHNAAGRNFNGALYVATPQLLEAFGIKTSQLDPTADVLTMRPGLSGLSKMQLTYGNPGGGTQVSIGPGNQGNGNVSQTSRTQSGCDAANQCLANPTIEQVSALPAGTSAPNTVITEYAVHKFHLQTSTAAWLIQSPAAPTAAQISSARSAASLAGMTLETKNSQPTSATIINWATVFGIALALGILAMSVGLIRSETAGDLRTLTAMGASSSTRRTLTAVTAGALGLLGAVLGTMAGYIGVIGWIRSNSLNGGISALASVPVENLLLILVGMPLVAAIAGWLLAGREPSAISRQPAE